MKSGPQTRFLYLSLSKLIRLAIGASGAGVIGTCRAALSPIFETYVFAVVVITRNDGFTGADTSVIRKSLFPINHVRGT